MKHKKNMLCMCLLKFISTYKAYLFFINKYITTSK